MSVWHPANPMMLDKIPVEYYLHRYPCAASPPAGSVVWAFPTNPIPYVASTAGEDVEKTILLRHLNAVPSHAVESGAILPGKNSDGSFPDER